MGDNSDDCEMECDFISRPSMPPPSNLSFLERERPSTPPNNLSSISSDICLTPIPKLEVDPDSSFLKRVGFGRFKRQGYTSTPLFLNRLSNTLPNSTATSQVQHDLRQCKSAEHIQSLRFCSEPFPFEYINPFTRDGKLLSDRTIAQKKLKRFSISPVRKLDLSDSIELDKQSNQETEEIDVPARPRLSEFNVCRFNEEFVQLKEIGKGVHGCVYKCLNRINGCVYAIKRTIKPIRSSIQEQIIRNEIYAHAVLDHPNIVRNYSCWKEEGFVFIQNEYCNGGSLEEYIYVNLMPEGLICCLIFQMAHALRYMHSKGLAHMDVKPGNILLIIEKVGKESSIDSDYGYSDNDKQEEITFKLGDLGHITRLDEDQDVEEGDCRYLPREILKENYQHLDRADIFALGLTVYEAAGGGPLPKNGEEWQEIRNGKLKNLEHLSKELNSLLESMVQPTPEKRPSALELIKLVSKLNSCSPVPEDMLSCLQNYRHNKSFLERKVETAGQYLKVLAKSHKQLQEQLGREKLGTPVKDKITGVTKKRGSVTKTRMVGKKATRSSSTTLF